MILEHMQAGWSARRLKSVAEVTPSGVDKDSRPGEQPVLLCNYLDVYRHERITGDLKFMEATATPAEAERMALRAGDVIITKDSETPHDIAVPAIVEASAEGVVCGYHLARIRPIPGRISGRYLFWALKAAEVATQFSVRAQGVTRFGLTVGGIGAVCLPLPATMHEQEAIVDHLDAETSALDQVRRSCEEAKQVSHERVLAIATNAIAEASASCRVVELRRVLRGVEQGWSPVAEDRSVKDGEWGVLKLSAVKRGRFLPNQHKALPGNLRPRPHIAVRDGDLLLTRSNTLETVGDACVVRSPPPRLMLSDLIYRLVPDPERADPDYLCLWLLTRHARQQIEADARGTSLSMVKVSQELLRRWLVPLPSPDEQRAIVARVKAAQADARSVMEDADAMVRLVAERRAAVISDAVTGRMRIPSAGHVALTELEAA